MLICGFKASTFAFSAATASATCARLHGYFMQVMQARSGACAIISLDISLWNVK